MKDMKDSTKTYKDDLGLLVKEVTEVTDLDSGATQEVHEVHRQEVPMRLEQRVTKKLAKVPIEEKTEIFRTDGSVETKIKSADHSLDSLDLKQAKTCAMEQNMALVLQRLDALEGRDKQLVQKVDQLLARKAQHAAECRAKAQQKPATAAKGQVGVDFGKNLVTPAKKPAAADNDPVLKALAKLSAKVDNLEAGIKVDAKPKTSFMERAEKKYAEDVVATESQPNTLESILTAVGWIAFAVVGGLVVLALV